MTFTKKTWKDRVSQYINRRLLTDSYGNTQQVTVTRDEGSVTEAGDAFSASNMNDLENRIEAAIPVKIQDLDNVNLTTSDNNKLLGVSVVGSDISVGAVALTAADIPYSSGVSVADKLGDLNRLIKVVFSGNISKTLSSGQNLAILGNEVIASADMPSGYTPITLLSSYSTNSNCTMYSYDASTVGGTGTFCFIKNNTNSSQSIIVNYRVVFIKSGYVS